MVPVLIVPLITEALRTLNFFLEGVPVAMRQAQALIWFVTTWPLVRGVMKLTGVSDAELKQIEELARGTNGNSDSKS